MIASVVLALLSVPALAWTTYLATLSLLSLSERTTVATGEPTTRIDVIVPAHDEELGIAATVKSLLAADYPAPQRRVIVVADNCRDATAVVAAQAGAVVLERHDPERRGKGYALAYGFDRSLGDGVADAVAIVDADTVVTPNLLRAFDARIRRGAPAVQAHYGVANRQASWRTRLMHIGFTLFHDVRSRGRERMGLSAGLRGNGMAFAVSTLREVPHDAYSIVEDVEYGVRLGLAGHRVWYAGEAQVLGAMVSSERASRSQRERWEQGRAALARRQVGPLLVEAVRRRSGVIADLAADLLVPPLTYVALTTSAGLGASLAWWVFGHGAWWVAAPWCTAAVAFAVYVARGLWLSGAGLRGIVDLLWAPAYIAWKLALMLRPSASRANQWVRTSREEGDKP